MIEFITILAFLLAICLGAGVGIICIIVLPAAAFVWLLALAVRWAVKS